MNPYEQGEEHYHYVNAQEGSEVETTESSGEEQTGTEESDDDETFDETARVAIARFWTTKEISKESKHLKEKLKMSLRMLVQKRDPRDIEPAVWTMEAYCGNFDDQEEVEPECYTHVENEVTTFFERATERELSIREALKEAAGAVLVTGQKTLSKVEVQILFVDYKMKFTISTLLQDCDVSATSPPEIGPVKVFFHASRNFLYPLVDIQPYPADFAKPLGPGNSIYNPGYEPEVDGKILFGFPSPSVLLSWLYKFRPVVINKNEAKTLLANLVKKEHKAEMERLVDEILPYHEPRDNEDDDSDLSDTETESTSQDSDRTSNRYRPSRMTRTHMRFLSRMRQIPTIPANGGQIPTHPVNGFPLPNLNDDYQHFGPNNSIFLDGKEPEINGEKLYSYPTLEQFCSWMEVFPQSANYHVKMNRFMKAVKPLYQGKMLRHICHLFRGDVL